MYFFARVSREETKSRRFLEKESSTITDIGLSELVGSLIEIHSLIFGWFKWKVQGGMRIYNNSII